MGYSLCTMAVFQNGLISRIFGVFSSGFFGQNVSKWFVEWILTCFLEFYFFDPKWGFCMGYTLSMMANFQIDLISRVFCVFRAVSCTEEVKMMYRMDFNIFLKFLIFDIKWRSCKRYSLCVMHHFQNGLISWIFGVFSSDFFHTTSVTDL